MDMSILTMRTIRLRHALRLYQNQGLDKQHIGANQRHQQPRLHRRPNVQTRHAGVDEPV